MSQVAQDPLEAGREAAARGAWREAYDFLAGAASPLARDLELLAEAAYWTGRLDEATHTRERAYTAYLDDGDEEKAALLALFISRDYWGRADLAIGAGWFAKAERLLEGKDESIAHGYLAALGALNAAMVGDIAGAIEKSQRALDSSRRTGDRNLEALALVSKGGALVHRGDVADGFALFDEATAAAVSGDLQPWTTGLIYCATITSCHQLGDIRRATEWTKAANSWCDRLDLAGFPGACRVHNATLTRLHGDWPRAEQQALQACDELHAFDAWTTGAGFYEIGEIRRRRGDFAAAEEAYRSAKEWGRDPQPGLALLRLAQGKLDAARGSVRRSLTKTEDPLMRLQLLPAAVEVALAAGDLKDARAGAEDLDALAETYKMGEARTPAFEAAACLAWGRIRLAENDAEGAIGELERAAEIWRGVGAPYEAAEAQLVLGMALRKTDQEDEARDELTAAKAVFERLGAALDVERISELLGEHGVRRTFMFTDIVDSTKLVEALGEDKWRKLLGWHDRQLRELIENHGGEVIKQTGDGYFAAFQTPGPALDTAVAIQRTLDEHEPLAPDVRIGLHTGGAFHREDDDYAGQGVHTAARIGALAGAGEILVSKDSVDGASPYPLSPAHELELKGLEEPVAVCQVRWR
jgi:class 3 adenylate cyclase